ncbi:FMN-binding negative transcriptional regulator [Jiangella sp. DSM 45060]|uniref:FMN-binding negative transcriptional regulator n=1 Tax=Jiangella sp. DSM 45060 TaxID=1798224 RepID=UPI00087AE92D|nr:FMN-binding negative transcriptional regulator [Jiangella sp. DSM 45060]SDS07584.1 negative transcriptional regulator, PaiB family [Jiangella sp. DSM 45060]
MHTPRHFRADSPDREGRLVRENPFGLIICGSGVAADAAAGAVAPPVATHVPMLRKPGPNGRPPADGEPLLGGAIVGHLAKVNPQAAALRTAGSALAVFLGPDGYVSPTWYDGDRPNVPTWNYAAVHVSGPLRVVDDRDEALAIIMASIDATEAYAGTGWDPTPSLDYVDQLLAGIVAFELTAADVRSTFKLSQNKPVETQRRVAATLATSTHGRDREVAALMTDVLRLGEDGTS